MVESPTYPAVASAGVLAWFNWMDTCATRNARSGSLMWLGKNFLMYGYKTQ